MTPNETLHPLESDPTETPPALLDIDGEDVVPAPAPAADPTPQPAPVVPTPKGRTVTEDEYALLMEKAGVIDLIQENPQLAEYVATTLRGGIGQPEPEPDPGEFGEDIAQHPAFKALNARVEVSENAAKQAAAAAQIMTFGQSHPDMVEHQEAISELVRNHGMDLPTAYKHAKALAGANGATPKPRVGAAEGHGRVTPEATDDNESDILAAARAKINDPKRRVRIEDAMDIAFEAATQAHNQQEM